MDPAVAPGLAGLVGRVGVGRPLQLDGLGRTLLEGQVVVLVRHELAQPAGEVVVPGEAGQSYNFV